MVKKRPILSKSVWRGRQFRFWRSVASGSPVPQGAYTYFAHRGDVALWSPLVSGLGTGDDASLSVTIYVQASSTVYRNTDGTGAITTSYVRTWYSGTGAAVYAYDTTFRRRRRHAERAGVRHAMVYDERFRPLRWATSGTWMPTGISTLSQYSAATGLLMESVANVDTADLPATLTGAADTVAVPLDSSSDPLFATPSGDTTNLNVATDYTDDSPGPRNPLAWPCFP